MKLHLDFETCSDVDLREVGLMNYVTHPSTRVLLAAFAGPDEYIHQLSYEEDFDTLQGLVWIADEIHAWNAPFEWAVMRYVLDWPVDLRKMHCTMAHALYRAFPAKLDACAKVFGLPGKPADATRLLNLWSMGKGKAKPGDWDRFCEYNINDVVMEREIARRLEAYPWPRHEREVWLMGEEINWRGVRVDLPAAINAWSLHQQVTEEALYEIKRLTGVANPNSPSQLAKWLGVKSLDKKEMPALIEAASGERRRVLELRQQVALTAPKKYAVAIAQQHNGRMRNMLQYSGAGRTHRWSGRGLQPQNLRRGWKDDDKIRLAWKGITMGIGFAGDPFIMLADLVRTIIIPTRGQLAVADYSSIEVVMLHWAAGDESMLQDLRNGLDPYKRFASSYFGIPIDQVTKDQRTFAKPVVLGCGYGLGPVTLVEYAAGMGVQMDEKQALRAVRSYREANSDVVSFWYGLESAMLKAINKPGKRFAFGRFSFKADGTACLCRLPSGSEITYWAARVEDDRIVYDGVNQVTGHWGPIRTWGGKLVENVVQSISRDVLVHGLQRAGEAGLQTVLHVHDEVVVEDADEDALQALLGCLVAPGWAEGAPIRAAGFLCPRYRKD